MNATPSRTGMLCEITGDVTLLSRAGHGQLDGCDSSHLVTWSSYPSLRGSMETDKTTGTWLQKHHWKDSREGCCQERVGHNKHYPWQEIRFRLPEEWSILCSLRSLQNLCQGCVTGLQHCFVARTWIKPPGRALGGKMNYSKHPHPFKGHVSLSWLAEVWTTVHSSHGKQEMQRSFYELV